MAVYDAMGGNMIQTVSAYMALILFLFAIYTVYDGVKKDNK